MIKSHIKKIKQNIKDNYDWYIKKAEVDKFQGEWIAVENKKIVVHDCELQNVLDEVNKNWPHAAITKVPKRGQIMVL